MTIHAPIRLAVVTGGHNFDVPNFHRLFRCLADADTYIQHMDDFATSPKEIRDAYDVVLFYTMLREGPSDEYAPWDMGKTETVLTELGQADQGILFLHHAILAYPQWDRWSEMVGIADRSFDYHLEQEIRVRIARQDHPVTGGLGEWEMVDETYTMAEPDAECEVLLTVDHPKSMKAVAWTRSFGKSRVLCLQSGHDNRTWSDHNFLEVLRRGVLWCGGRI